MSRVTIAALSMTLLSACADPHVQIRFEIPDAYRDSVSRIEITVYTPVGDNLFSCDDVAFDLVPSETLEASRHQVITAARDERRALLPLPRVGTKLLVARAKSRAGELVSGGCAAIEIIEGDRAVTISARPATVLVMDERAPYGDPPPTVALTTQDFRGEVLANTPVRWYRRDSSGELEQQQVSDGAGRLVFERSTVAAVGPVVDFLYSPWQRGGARGSSYFKLPPRLGDKAISYSQPAEEQTYEEMAARVAILPTAEGREVLVMLGGEQSTSLLLVEASGSPPQLVPTIVDLDEPLHALGVIHVGGAAQAVGLSEKQWHTIDSALQLTSRQRDPSLPPGPARRLFDLSACDAGSDARVLVELEPSAPERGAGGFEIVDAEGARLAEPAVVPEGVRVLASGCVAAPLDQGVRMLFIDNTALDVTTLGYALIHDGELETSWWHAAPWAIEVYPHVASSTGEVYRSGYDTDGFYVARSSLRSTYGELELRTLQRYEILLPLLTLAVGDIGGDGAPDFLGAVSSESGSSGEIETRIFASFSTEYRGTHLAGVSKVFPGMVMPELVDFDGDGRKEIVFISSTHVAVYGAFGAN